MPEFLDAVDNELYKAKENGRNQVSMIDLDMLGPADCDSAS
jgi:hypothetical protein